MHNQKFFAGLQAGASIAIGYFPAALTFGLLAKTAGLTLLQATAMSAIVFAGASQYMALNLLATAVSPWMIIINTFTVNIRHFLMAAALNEQVAPEKRWVKALYAFFLTDESFSVLAAARPQPLSTAYIFGVSLIGYSSWVFFSAFGFIIGSSLPTFLQAAMSFALYAMFIGLLVPALKGSKKVVLLASLAACLHSLFYFTGWLSKGWSIFISALLAATLIEWLYTHAKKNPLSQWEEGQ